MGTCTVGGTAPITVQTMLSVPWRDLPGNVAQAKEAERAGCEILRVAVPDLAAVPLIPAIKEAVGIPLVADIHFDYRIALAAADAGADKIRINPGNIGDRERVRAVAEKCREKGIPIRIGVNSGSLEKHILAKHGAPTAEALAESALYHAGLLEACDFEDLIIAIKSSDVRRMIRANEILAEACDYPLHLGVTEAGTPEVGTVKSAVGIGSLLARGIGDTIRVSLTADPIQEVAVGREILSALSLRGGLRLISCPTCGRTRVNLMKLAREAREALGHVEADLTVAIMGCEVNGPGEAREADFGIAGGDGRGILFRKGEILRKLPEEELLPALVAAVKADVRTAGAPETLREKQ